MSDRGTRLTVAWTTLVGLLPSIVPLPYWLLPLRPACVVLVVIYWSTMAPYLGGLALGFFSGLALDAFQGSVLGEHALALSFVAYIAVRQNLMMRAKPVFQQSLFVAGVLLSYELVLWAVDGWTGHAGGGLLRWLHIPVGAALWPLASGLLGRSHSGR